MDRKDFLSTFSLGLAAVCGAGCLASCSKDNAQNPSGGSTNNPPVIPPSGTTTINLNSELLNINDTVVRNGIIIVRLAQGALSSSFTAVQVACTHQGTSINFSSSQGNFICPNHGSQFTLNGDVINGPASSNLKKYTITISGSTLTVTS